MNTQTAVILFIAIIIASVLAFVFLVADFAKEKEAESNKCLALGCNSAATSVGSKETKELYSCTCPSIPQIEKQNIECFISPSTAIEQGYINKNCP